MNHKNVRMLRLVWWLKVRKKVQDYGIAQDLCRFYVRVVAKNANGRDAESAKAAEVR